MVEKELGIEIIKLERYEGTLIDRKYVLKDGMCKEEYGKEVEKGEKQQNTKVFPK